MTNKHTQDAERIHERWNITMPSVMQTVSVCALYLFVVNCLFIYAMNYSAIFDYLAESQWDEKPYTYGYWWESGLRSFNQGDWV